ncbi:MAG: amidohydrolase [Cyclonatronaceae bacterium]
MPRPILMLPLLFAALSILMLSCTPAPDTLIIHNVSGYTLVGGQECHPSGADLHRFDAIAIRDGRVLQTGTAEELRGAFPGAERMDGKGRTLLPGLIDAHAHVMGLGDARLTVNVMGIGSLAETLDEVARYAESYPDLAWIRGRGWNQVLWEEDRFPTAKELDRAVAGRPVWLTRVDGHAGWANTEAMRLAGVTRDTEDPEGGAIIRDDDGNPTGVFIDRAMDLVRRHIPPPEPPERRLALTEALEEIRSVGLTGVHDAGVGVDDFLLMKEFGDQGHLTARLYGMIGGTGEDFDRFVEGVADLPGGPLAGYADDRLFLQSVKIYADGALGSRGAALLEDYSDDPGNRGLLLYPEEELLEMVNKAVSHGYQVGTHAIGDRANRMMLNVFEKVFEKYDPDSGVRELRHRIEHAQVVHPEDIPRFRELGIVAAMQPVHATSDMNMAEDRLGAERMAGAYAWRTFLEEDVVLAAGSDFPVERSNPFHGLHAAVTRQDHDGQPESGWYPEQRLTREEALHGFTLGAACAGRMEPLTGSLEPGKWADFILIDRDYFNVSEQEIWQIDVEETWLAGERVFRKESDRDQ